VRDQKNWYGPALAGAVLQTGSFAGLSRQFCLLRAISAKHEGLLCFRLCLLIWYGESWWRPPSPSRSPRPSSTSSPASSSSASSSSSSWWASPTATGAVAIGAAAAVASAVQTVSREGQKSRSTQTTWIGRFSTWRQGKRETASFRPPQDGKHPVTRLSKWHFNDPVIVHLWSSNCDSRSRNCDFSLQMTFYCLLLQLLATVTCRILSRTICHLQMRWGLKIQSLNFLYLINVFHF